jgi:hypothetical protein
METIWQHFWGLAPLGTVHGESLCVGKEERAYRV